jgi:hypothetical protein
MLLRKGLKMNALTVTMTIRPSDLYDIVQMAIDDLEESFGDEVMEAAGVNEQELFDAILEDKEFQSMVINQVREDGTDVLQNPYDYFSGYDFLETIPGLMRVVDLCKEMDERIKDANLEPAFQRVEVPKGYMLVKIA